MRESKEGEKPEVNGREKQSGQTLVTRIFSDLLGEDVSEVLSGFVEDHPTHLQCVCCSQPVLKIMQTRPFVKNIPVSYNTNRFGVYTRSGFLLKDDGKSVAEAAEDDDKSSIELDVEENVCFVPRYTPRRIKFAGQNYRNLTEEFLYCKEYKAVFNEALDAFEYMCYECLLDRRKTRASFCAWMYWSRCRLRQRGSDIVYV